MTPLIALVVPLALALAWWLGWRRGLGAAARALGSGPPEPGPRQLRAWLDAAPQGWLVLDPWQRVQAINPRAERLLQLPTDRLVRGQSITALVSGSELEEAIRRVRLHQRPQRLEWQQGNEALEAVLLPGDDGWLGLWLGSRRSVESQLDQQSRWVSDVAHELKTPLTALMLVGDSLAARSTGSDTVLVERLQRELQRLQSLVSDLLELSRLENSLPRDEGRYEVLDLCELVDAAWGSLRPLAERRGVSLHFPSRPPSLLWGDASRLHRALLNLFDNALRYSPDGGLVEVSVGGGGRWWELVVRDQGPGFSEDDLAHLFERFYRGDPSRVRSGRAGSGLGLAIVQQIALTHGGRVLGRNHPEGGAVMELVLPRGV